MKIKTLCLLILVMVGIQACAEPAPPVCFSTLKFNDAKQASLDQDKYLLVDATATWCGPCKRMETTTWVDARVVSWLEKRAIAIQVDVDADVEDSKMLLIEAMPTVILFKNGEELDRSVGYMDANKLLTWLNGVLELE